MHGIIYMALLVLALVFPANAADYAVNIPASNVQSVRTAILSVALPQELIIIPGETLRQAVTRQCLAMDDAYLSHLRARFFALNPNLRVLGGNDLVDSVIIGAVRFMAPPCLTRSPAATEEAPVAYTLEQRVILSLYYGYGYGYDSVYVRRHNYQHYWRPDWNFREAAADLRNRCQESQEIRHCLRLAPEITSDVLQPFLAIWGEENGINTEEVPSRQILEIMRARGCGNYPVAFRFAVPEVNEAEVLKLIARNGNLSSSSLFVDRGRLVVADEIEKPCTVKNLSSEFQVAEFDALQIISALFLNRILQKRWFRGELGAPSTTIEIADSGLYQEAIAPLTNSGYWGAELIPDKDYKYAQHGTEVAAIALGGPDIALVNRFSFNVGVKPKQIIRKEPIELTFEHAVNKDLLETAMYELESRGGADIVNLSVRFPKEVREVEHAINSGRVLIVVAAGNSGDDLQNKPAWPAKYGGGADRPVITVGAVERDGTRAPFSNYSDEHVDIGALGCDVRTWNFDADARRFVEKRASGTSFAAPAVTAVAAWLKHVLGEFTPVELKHHIISSADIFPKLTGIKDNRVLNAIKALRSVHADVVETIDPYGNKHLFTGHILSSNGDGSFDLGGRNFRRELLRKVARLSDNKYLLYQIVDKQEAFADKKELGYLFAETEIAMKNAMDGSEIRIATASIADIVFAHKPYWE